MHAEYLCITDTIVVVEADTAQMQALLECDSLGNVLMLELRTLQGQRTSIAPQFRYITMNDTNGEARRKLYLDVMALSDSLEQCIYNYEKREVQYQTVIRDMKEKAKKHPPGLLLGIAIGFVLTLIIILGILTLKK